MSRASVRRLGARLGLAMLLSSGGAAAVGPVREVEVRSLPCRLGGTWELAPGDPPGGVLDLDSLTFRRVAVPGTWQESGLSDHGTAWYRLRLRFVPEAVSLPLAFATAQIRDVDEVYLDGILVGKTGSFPPAYDKATFVSRVYELPAALTSRAGTHVLAIRVFNAGPRGGGLTGEPVLDSVSGALLHRARREVPRVVLAGAIGALGLLSLFIFLRDRTQYDFLYFFIYTSGFAVYIVTWLSGWTRTPVPLSLLFRVNLAGNFFLFAVFLLFFQRFFEHPITVRQRLLLAIHAAGVLGCLFWPRVDDLYYALPICYVTVTLGSLDILVTLARDARRSVPYARPILFGSILVFLAVLFDIGQDFGVFGDPAGSIRLVPPTFFVFTVVFLSVVADRFARFRVAASTDPLTGLANRSVLLERMALEVARGRRHGHPVALAVLDLDHFKDFNDRHGHQAGDRLLVETTRALAASIRDTDLAARYGGEEFVALLPEAGAAEALLCLERVRLAVRRARVPGVAEGTTISIGIAVFDPAVRPAVSINAFFRQADSALYEAKSKGRDTIVLAEGNPPTGSSSGIFTFDRFRRPGGSGTNAARS